MKLSATHTFNYIALRIKFGITSYEHIPSVLTSSVLMIFPYLIAFPFTVNIRNNSSCTYCYNATSQVDLGRMFGPLLQCTHFLFLIET